MVNRLICNHALYSFARFLALTMSKVNPDRDDIHTRAARLSPRGSLGPLHIFNSVHSA